MLKMIFLLICGLLSGCAARFEPQAMFNAAELKVQLVAHSSSVAVMAVSPDGQMVAWGNAELKLQNLQTGLQIHPLKLAPGALCWAPDGSMLAATVQMGDETHLYVIGRDGVLIHEQHFPGYTGRMQWSGSGHLQASVIFHQAYSFGANISGHLMQWDERWRMTQTPLYETTIIPSIDKVLSGRLQQILEFDLSPLEDEILYTRVHAPPAFAASRRLVLRNLQTGQEKLIAALPLLEGEGRLAEDGETAMVNDGLGLIRLQNMWSDKILAEWVGGRFDYDASSGLLTTGAGLFQAERLLLKLPAESRTRLSVGGRFMLVYWRHVLYLLSGYPLQKNISVNPVIMEKLLKLRRLRSRGLIETGEYQQARERLLR